MARLRAPDGEELEVTDPAQIAHYQSLGASLVGPDFGNVQAGSSVNPADSRTNPVAQMGQAIGSNPVGRFAQGAGRFAVNSIPAATGTLGTMGGALLGGAMGVPTGPGLIATGAAGGMAGGAAGAGAGQMWRNSVAAGPVGELLGMDAPTSPTEGVQGQATMGGVFGAIPGAGAAAKAGYGAVAKRVSPRLVKTLAKIVIPGAGKAAHAKELLEELSKLGPEAQAATKKVEEMAAKAAPEARAAARRTSGKIAGEIKPGNPAEARIASKAKPRPSRPMQGKSRPALERQSAARAQATGKNPPDPGLTGLEDMDTALKLEQHFTELGLGPQERVMARMILRQGGSLEDISQLARSVLGGP